MTWLAALPLMLAPTVHAGEETFYLGTFTGAPGGSEGIYVGSLDTETGKLGPLRLAAKETNPTFLALSPDRRFLFATLDQSVESFAVAPDGTLRPLSRQPSGGKGTCHVSVDRSGREIFVANYDSSSVAGFPVGRDGKIGPREAFKAFTGSGPNKARQEAPHPHSVSADPENKFVYVCDLGTDKVWIFRLGIKGGFIPADPSFAQMPAGSGPRHLAFDGDFVYVVSEMGVTTCVFQRDKKTGALRLVENMANLPRDAKPDSNSAEVALHPSGKWVYVSTRDQDALTVFRVDRAEADSAQRLKPVQAIVSPVKFPRSFAIDPRGRWMIVAGQNDHRISVMKIDPDSGELAPTHEFAGVGSPVCVLFVPR